MMNFKDILRIAAIGAVLLAGSCASPTDELSMADPMVNHPIAVEPRYAAIKLSFSAPDAGLLPDDAARFEAFVADYLSRGSGSISVSAPQGADSATALTYFGARLFSMGVPRSDIMVGTHDGAEPRVEIGYIAYGAKTDPCGDWSDNVAMTYGNRPTRNFGCAVQHNIAAQVADPRDLIEMRPSDPADTVRRGQVLDNYEKGKVTASEKSKAQSGAVSEVNNN
jgi:pilus assembly protein CpaD